MDFWGLPISIKVDMTKVAGKNNKIASQFFRLLVISTPLVLILGQGVKDQGHNDLQWEILFAQ